MALNECYPFRKPGREGTATATAAITGKRFVGISAAPTLIGDNPSVAHATAAARAYGVSAHDIASGSYGLIHTGQGLELPVTADGAITAGQDIEVGTAGKAKTAASGKVVAIAISSAADGADVRVQLR